jgi:shikimate 5-dehydrogenase
MLRNLIRQRRRLVLSGVGGVAVAIALNLASDDEAVQRLKVRTN